MKEQKDKHAKELAAIDTYGDKGTECFEKGEMEKAAEWYEKALEISERVLGEEHQDTLDLYLLLAETYKRQDNENVTPALDYYMKALKVMEAKGIRDHMFAHVHYSIGCNLFKCDHFEEAFYFLEKAVEIGEEVYGTEDLCIAPYYHSAAINCLHLEKLNQAKEYIDKCIAIRKKNADPNDPDLENSYLVAGLACAALDDIANALKYFQKVLKIKEATLGEDHEETQNARDLIEMVAAGKVKQ